MSENAVPSLLQYVRRLAATAATDEQLLADFIARRSNEAFSALLGRHGPMVLNVGRRILNDAHAAEDVFQATFLVLADRAGAIRRPASLASFLHGVAYRLAIRARRRRIRDLPAVVCDKIEDPSEGLVKKEMLSLLDQELSRLSDDSYRAPLVLCYLEGRTQDQAARQLGWSLNTFRRRLAQGRHLLEARLRGRGVTLPALLAGLAGSFVVVPGQMRAAALAAASARAIGAGTAGTAGPVALSSAKKGITFLLSTLSNKVGALVAVAVLGAAIGFGYCLAPHADQAPPASESPAAASVPFTGAVPGDPMADPLPPQAFVRLGTDRYRYGSPIGSMGVSADGRLAVVSGGVAWFSGLLWPPRVFDLTDGRCLYSLLNEAEAVGLSPDGKTLAAKDGMFLVFRDAASGKELRKLRYLNPDLGGGRSGTNFLTFTPDGKQVAVTLLGHDVQLVDVETAQVVRKFSPEAAATACAFSPDGKWMATAGYEYVNGTNLARIWEVNSGKELRRFPAARFPSGNGMTRTLAFSPDGAMLAGGGWGDQRLRLWETATGKEMNVFPKIGGDIQSVAFAPDGKTVAAGAERIYLYDPVTGKERLRIEPGAVGLAFNRDGSVLTGAVRGAIYRWDAASGRQLTPAAAQDWAVEQILVSPDGRSLFTTDQEGNLFRWDTAGGPPPRRIAGEINWGMVASSDRRFLAWTVPADHGNSRIRLYDVATDRLIDPVLRSSAGFPVMAGKACVAAFLPDGQSLLTLDEMTATFRLWEVESSKRIRGKRGQTPEERESDPIFSEVRSFTVIPPKSEGVPNHGLLTRAVPFCTHRRAALSPDGRMLAIGPDIPEGFRGEDSSTPVRLWDVATGKAGHKLNEPIPIVNRSDKAASGRDGFPPRGPFMKSIDGRAFSPDGRFLVDWAENRFGRSRIDHVYVWETATGRAVATLVAGPGPGAANAAFAPDGRTLATASADGIIRLWEVATWKVRAEFRGHRDRITAVAFGPDGRLFTGGLDTVVLGWDVKPPRTTRGTLAEAWEALIDADAKVGFQAQGRFVAEPAKAVEWIATRVTPVELPDPSRVKALIADLDSDDFATRERATGDLKEHGPLVAAALRQVVAPSSSAEARRRAENLLNEMANGFIPPSQLRALRSVEVLEFVATKVAWANLFELTKGAPEARLTREAAAACKRLERR